jgi:hypothetical protein
LADAHLHVVHVVIRASHDGSTDANGNCSTGTFKIVNDVLLPLGTLGKCSSSAAAVRSNNHELISRFFSVSVVFLGAVKLEIVLLANFHNHPILPFDSLVVVHKAHDSESHILVGSYSIGFVGKPSEHPMILCIKALVRIIVG